CRRNCSCRRRWNCCVACPAWPAAARSTRAADMALRAGFLELPMNSLPAILVSLLLAGCEAPGQPSTPAQPAAPATQAGATVDPAHLDAVLESFVRDGKVVGVSALVHQHGREVYSGAFGQADREAGRAMARDTLVQVWSMTKPVTGVVLM